MKNTIVAIAAFTATAAAQSMGTASVLNKCAYPVWLEYVPAADGGANESDQWLPANTGSWAHEYQVLTNDQGWSIKLMTEKGALNIMQYEYTVHGDGNLWYDISDVNGNPFDGAWQIGATGNADCVPKQHAYMYPTDDKWGEQMCAQDANVIVTLCGGPEGASGSSSSSYNPPPAAPSTSAAAPSVAPTPSTTSTKGPAAASAPVNAAAPSSATSIPAAPAASSASAWNGEGWSAAGDAQASLTTLSAVVTPAPSPADGDVFVVTTTVVAYTTVDVAPPTKRDVENHHQHHLHHARHPHGGRF